MPKVQLHNPKRGRRVSYRSLSIKARMKKIVNENTESQKQTRAAVKAELNTETTQFELKAICKNIRSVDFCIKQNEKERIHWDSESRIKWHQCQYHLPPSW